MTTTSAHSYGLIGWNGRQNVGDDAMTSVIVNYIGHHNPNATFKLLADEDGLAQYGAAWRLSGYFGYDALHRVPYIRRVLRRSLFLRRFVQESDTILIGGGSIFHNIHTSYWHREVALMKKKVSPTSLVGAIGVSVGPFTQDSERTECERALNALDFVVVRDERSLSLINKMNVRTKSLKAMDPAILLPDLINCRNEDLKPLESDEVGVALCEGALSDETMNHLSMCLNRSMLMHPRMKLVLFVFCGHKRVGDTRLTQKMKEAIKDKDRVEVFGYSREPSEFYRRISNCRMIIAMRLHAAVIAYAVGTPFIMLSYAQKCDSFAREIGLSAEYLFEVSSLPCSAFEDRLTQSLAARYQFHKPWTLDLSDAKRLSQINFSFLGKNSLENT